MDAKNEVHYCAELNDEYPPNFWALQNPEVQENFIACVTGRKSGTKIAIKFNHTDVRGYRIIVTVYNPGDMKSVLNRRSTHKEYLDLLEVVAVVMVAYEELHMVPQGGIFGNMSHRMVDNIVTLGTKKEPTMLHAHLWGRGDIERKYLAGIELGGAPFGENFDIINGKIKWKPDKDNQPNYMDRLPLAIKEFQAVLNPLLEEMLQ